MSSAIKQEMTTVQTKQIQNKKKKRRSQVTFEESNQFLARPIQKIEDLDKSLTKSYEKDFFRHDRFKDLKQLKQQLKNKEKDSVDSQPQSDESVFSLHNDQRTIKRRARQRQMKKVSSAKIQQKTNPDQNQTPVVAKHKRNRKKPQPKQKTLQQKKMKEQGEENQSNQDSQSSSSGSSNSETSSSQQSQSGSESENENQKQSKQSEQQQNQPQPSQTVYKKKSQEEEQKIEKSKSEENQSEQNQSQQQQSMQKEQEKQINNTETQAQKYMIKDKNAGEGKTNIKSQEKTVSPKKKSVSPKGNNRRVARRKQPKKEQTSEEKLDQPQTSKKPEQPINSSHITKEDHQKIKTQHTKMTQQTQPQAINQLQPQKINIKYKPIFIIQPSKREHNLEYCSKVIVQSLYFRNHYIVAPYLAVSQLSTPYNVPYQLSPETNIIRLKKITQKIDEQQKIEPQKKMTQMQHLPIQAKLTEPIKDQPDLVTKKLRSHKRR